MKRLVFIFISIFLSIYNYFAQLETKYVKYGKNGAIKEQYWRFTIDTDNLFVKAENILVTKYYNFIELPVKSETDSLNIFRFVCKEGDKIIHKMTSVIPKDKRDPYMLIDNMVVNGRDLGDTYYISEIDQKR